MVKDSRDVDLGRDDLIAQERKVGLDLGLVNSVPIFRQIPSPLKPRTPILATAPGAPGPWRRSARAARAPRHTGTRP